jgi:hypothetical protein
MTADEIHELEQQMDALAREYGATHDPKILAELKELSRRLRQLEDRSDAVLQRLLH